MAAPFTDYADRYSFSQSETFTNKVQVALMTTALAVLAEADNAHPNEVFRKRLARQVLRDPTSITPVVAMAVCTNSYAAGDDLTDPYIQQFVDTLFDTFAATGT